MAALPLIGAAFAVGIWLGRLANVPLVWIALVGMVAAALTIVFTMKKKSATVPLLLLFLFVGMFLSVLAGYQIHHPWSGHLGEERIYTGYIQEVLPAEEGRAAFLFRTESVTVGENEQPLSATVRVSIFLVPEDFVPEYGLRLQLRGIALTPASQRNPGGFDYAAYLESVGVGAVMSVRGHDLQVLDGRGGHLPLWWAHQLRWRALHSLQHYLPESSAGLASGLLLGDRHAVSEETVEAYRRLGIAHLLAVSGLHVGFVAAFALFLASRLFRGRGMLWQALLAAILVLCYVYLTGGRPPVWRAGLTMLLALYARQTGRERDGLLGLAAVGMLMLFFRPLWLFSLSFQFSFAATAGILLLSPRLQQYLVSLPPQVSGPMAVTVAAQLAVLPLQANHFGLFSLLAVPVNLLCVPLVGLVMALGLAGILFGLVSLPLSAPFLFAALPALLILEGLPQSLASLPFAALRVPVVHPVIWLLYGTLLVMFVARISFRPVTGKKLLAVLVGLNILLFALLPVWGQAPLEVTFIDVGQGMAVHVRTPAGSNLLIDAGKPGQGQFAVLPYLRAAGVRSLDFLILTHPHDDHYGGMEAVAEELPVGVFAHNGEVEESEAYGKLLTTLAAAGVIDLVLEEGYRLFLDEVKIEVLAPPAERFTYTVDDVNNNSLVLRFIYKDFALLITGDAETDAVRWLVNNRPQQLRHTLLQVPHHGSAGALSAEFLQLAKPQIAVIPVGHNSFGHPRQETLDLLAEHGIYTYRTDLHGAVTVTTDGYGWQVQPMFSAP
ncbi:DNA internalization-related competence protein ComEC/Rec2 [Dethiobacter alkaliphilus]|uniref:DNA internalization-related competence protein ComEC/Rec2 n=1 Tax=Dethiobacter alkaliphilus TaxID=427926 RepID=UPI00030027C5|nr:DNA internalization-related competence protein ComEC/Rec2 [Dethiobacter alkaliphilus]